MSVPAVSSFNDKRSAPAVNSEVVQREVLRVMREAGRSMTKSEIASCVRFTMLEVNIAIDRLQPDTITRAITHGVIRFSLVDAEPEVSAPRPVQVVRAIGVAPAVQAAPAEASEPAPSEHKPKCATTGIKSAVLRGLNEQAGPVSAADLAQTLSLGLQQVKSALKTLKIDGLAKLVGHRHHARWSASNQVVSQRSLEQPAAVQAEVTNNTATEGGVPKGYSRVETSASAPRDGVSTLEAVADIHALIKANADAAEREATARNAAPPEFADINDQIAQFTAQRRAERSAATRPIADATFALWSDGRLQVNTSDAVIEFTKGATRQLIEYLDQICEIDPTSRV